LRRRKSAFGADVLKLVSGTVFAQAITLATSPIITRLYSPDAFGVWAIFNSVTGIVGVVACLRYELSIMLPESDEEGANQLAISLLSVLSIASLSVVAVLLWKGPILAALKAPGLGPWLWMAPLAILVNGVYLALNYWNSRTRHFGRLSAVRVGASAASSAVQVGLGWAGRANGGALIASSVVGTGLSAAVLAGQIGREDGGVFRRGIRWRGIGEGIRRHRKFPIYSTFSALMNTISWQLPPILLQRFFAASVVGYYALGNRLLRLPMDLIGGAISQVFFQRAVAARAAGTLAELVEATYRRLIRLSLVPIVLLGLIAPEVFRLVFGSQWSEAGVYTQILSLWTFFWFLSSPLSTLFSVLERQELGLRLNGLILMSRVVALVLGGLSGDPRMALLLFALSGVFVYAYYSFTLLRVAGVRLVDACRYLGRGILEAAPAGGALFASRLLGAPVWAEIALAGALGAAYLVWLAKKDPSLVAALKSWRPAA
jgi:O-antigen/teichoic acid export membrane protein